MKLYQFAFFHAFSDDERRFALADIAFRDKIRLFVLFFDRGGELVFSAITRFVAPVHFARALAHGARLACLELLELVLGVSLAFCTIGRNGLWNVQKSTCKTR